MGLINDVVCGAMPETPGSATHAVCKTMLLDVLEFDAIAHM